MRILHVFLGTFLFTLLVQGTLWRSATVLDESSWVRAAGLVAAHDTSIRNEPGYGYPGAPLLFVPAALYTIGHVPLSDGLRGTLALLNSISIAGIAAVCYRLRPQSWWWVAAIGIVASNRLYLTATPPSIVVAPLLTLATILAIYLYEYPRNRGPRILLALIIGLAAATRIDISLYIAMMLGIVLWSRVQLRGLVVLAAAAFITFNPFMWTAPLQHLWDIASKILFHYYTTAPAILLPGQLLVAASFSLVSIGLACAYLFLPADKIPLPRRFIAIVLAATGLLAAIILTSRYQAVWYFYPLFFMWETLLPLLVLQAAQDMRFGFVRSAASQARMQHAVTIFIVLLLVGGHLTMLLHTYYLPATVVALPIASHL